MDYRYFTRSLGDKRELRGNRELLYLRVAAATAVILSLAGCSFFDFWSEPEGPEVTQNSTVRPDARRQFAALPDYLSDQDVSPGHIEVVRGEVVRGDVATPRRRPVPATAVLQARPIERQLILGDFLPEGLVLDIRPVAASFEPGSHTLADLIADRDWRIRTSETLNRLFQ